MKKTAIYLGTLSLAALLGACDLIQPKDIINPNVDEDNYLGSTSTMAPWRNGLERDFATTVAAFVEMAELVSDNYYNNYTQSSKVFDVPQIEYHDRDVTNLQGLVATLRETAVYGLDKIAATDPATTEKDLYSLRFIRAYSYLLAGEYFTGLPIVSKGEVKDWETNLNQAIAEFKALLDAAPDDTERATANLLIARAYHRLGDRTNAIAHAQAALSASGDFVRYVVFDGNNGVSNGIQGWIYGTAFQPLPRLDFLDPKYFQSVANEQRPIAIAKAEEAWLILAEAQIADHDLSAATATLKDLLALVERRPVAQVNDENETRGTTVSIRYPNRSAYRVAASAEDPLREGLVLDRGKDHPTVTVPYISGTSVTEEMIDAAAADGEDALLEILYLMRQEILFAEGRRMCDLGIRYPVCFNEASVNPTAAGYTEAQIPAFIPLDRDMDHFTLDEAAETVVIKYNMNRIIVDNKNTEYVVPFIH